jgi:SAM-dependent methyltransferase
MARTPNPYGSRKARFNWVSALDRDRAATLSELDRQMATYYSQGVLKENYHDRAEEGNSDWQKNRLFEPILARIQRGNLVIEFGCGTGYKGVGFQACGCRYVGLDFAVERQSHPGARNSLVAASCYYAPIETACADLTVSFYCLEHCTYPNRLLDEMSSLRSCLTQPGMPWPRCALDGRRAPFARNC